MSDPLLHFSILLLAFLYSSVGHAGASGYIAAMSLAGIAIEEIRPAALMLNLGVACFGIWNYARGGHLRWPLIWPFLPLALPCAWLGARIELSVSVISLVLGLVLLFSAIRFLIPQSSVKKEGKPPAAEPSEGKPPAAESSEGKPPAAEPSEGKPPPPLLAMLAGALLGFLAGLTGTGGGIFLTPLLLLCGWAQPKTAAGASIVFIAGNSLFGLAAFAAKSGDLPWPLMSLLPFAIIGGFAGSRLGSFRFSSTTIRRLLSVVLLLAAFKLVHGGLAS